MMLKTGADFLRPSAFLACAVLAVILLLPPFVYDSFALDEANGKKIYDMHCAFCHGADGRPITSDTPDFTMGEGLMKSDRNLFDVISIGVGIMPGYRGVISDGDIRDIIFFIRFNF
jgi:cytochrome c6